MAKKSNRMVAASSVAPIVNNNPETKTVHGYVLRVRESDVHKVPVVIVAKSIDEQIVLLGIQSFSELVKLEKCYIQGNARLHVPGVTQYIKDGDICTHQGNSPAWYLTDYVILTQEDYTHLKSM